MNEKDMLWLLIKDFLPVVVMILTITKPIVNLTKTMTEFNSHMKEQMIKNASIDNGLEEHQHKINEHSEKLVEHEERIKTLERK